MPKFLSVGSLVFLGLLSATAACAGIVIDHNDTDITALCQAEMQRAKDTLHIAYGHTSHGCQISEGMWGLMDFANNGGLGLSLPHNFFYWNEGGTDGGLDMRDSVMTGEQGYCDAGYYPDWYDNTIDYLEDPANADVNVIIWSWCGQVDSKYASGTLDSEYLTPMSQLEAAYPDVTFVYMTGHVDIWDDANNKAANQMIRDYAAANNKVLYDFTDIECYDPDGTYFEFVNDNCDYYDNDPDLGGSVQGNWATEWQAQHTEGDDWYDCSSAHSQPLNANRKAYAAWALWAEIAAMRRGDFDADGDVDVGDLMCWQRGELPNPCCNEDLARWQAGFDSGAAATGIGVVPEPSALVLLGLVTPLALRRR